MSEVLDVITNLSYQVEDAELTKAVNLIQKQIQNVGLYAQQMERLKRIFDSTAATEIDKRNRIATLIQKQKNLLDQTTQSMAKQVSENQKLQNAIVKEVGLINTLQAKLKALTEDRDKAFDAKQIDSFNKQIAITQGQIGKLTSPGSRTGGFGASILSGLGIGTGAALVTQGIQEVQKFIGESVRLATEAEGVFRAFDRLNRPDLLQNLRDSVRGTVSDLELAKQAVQFNNFGLPLERLGTALSFARQRAQDTGQSIDFLVQSIVTGIGRQSPLILDNLGINAKRVTEEFGRTGNFAEAAFNIIQEEAAKAGDALETFGDKQAQLNARIENLQVRAGKLFNIILGELSKGGNLALLAVEELYNKVFGVQEETEGKSIASLDKYFADYEKADRAGRIKIRNNAYAEYGRILQAQEEAQNKGLNSLANALSKQATLYDRFFRNTTGQGKGKANFSNFEPSDLADLTQEQLRALQAEGQLARDNAISRRNKSALSENEKRIKQIENALKAFEITRDRVQKKQKEKPVITLDYQDKRGFDDFEKELDEATTKLDEYEKVFGKLIAQREKANPNQVQADSLEQDIIAGRGGRIMSPAEAEVTNYNIGLQNKKREADKKTQEEEDEKRKQRIEKEKEAAKTISDAIISSYNTILQAQIASKDAEIQIRQSRVNAAIELAKNGNDEILKIEQDRLQESIKEREQYARRQAAINAILTVSESVLAIATAAGESGAGAIVIVPAVIAALASGFAAITALTRENTPAFKDGVVDIEGPGTTTSDSIQARISRGESVITAEATKKYRDELIAMNNGTYDAVMAVKYRPETVYNQYANMNTRSLESKLDELKTAVEENRVNVKQVMDAYGLTQVVETNTRRANAKWK